MNYEEEIKKPHNKRNIIILICISLLVVFTGCYFAFVKNNSNEPEEYQIEQDEDAEYFALNEDGSIYFKDNNLEQSLKKIMKLDTIYPDDALVFDHLILNNKKIKSLSGIEYFKNLKYLYLEDNEIVDISYLKYLSNLTYLDIGHNRINDVTDLADLKELEFLHLGDNNINDISPLINLKKLIMIPEVEYNTIINLELFEPNLELYYNNYKNITNIPIITNEENNEIEIKTAKDFDDDSYEECGDSVRGVMCLAKLNYEENKGVIDTYKKAMAVARDFVKNNINDSMSDIEKEAVIVKYIAKQMSYVKTEEREDDAYIHSYYYSLVMHMGQCYDYSKMFNILGYLSGLDVQSATSGFIHEWNLVKIDGVYYHTDITWADSNDDELDYDYINVSTNTINELHGEYGGQFIPKFYQTNISKTDMSKELINQYFNN